MKNKITNLKISNFKSIKDAELECGRINLFVGKPNVGKSNVLEALSLLGAHFGIDPDNKFMKGIIRYDNIDNLFYYNNVNKEIKINAKTVSSVNFRNNRNFITCEFNFLDDTSSFEYCLKKYIIPPGIKRQLDTNKAPDSTKKIEISRDGVVKNIEGDLKFPVKKYEFNRSTDISKKGPNYLSPPNGTNLVSIFPLLPELQEEVPMLFDDFNLEFVVDLYGGKFESQRKENGVVYKIPYELSADTIQRIIFHYAAIFSNKDSVILFEEPESHSYPPYIRELALKIIENTDNQYFITTHSPHLFTTIVEEIKPDDLAVFITYFENYETKFKKLNTDDINDLLNGGVNIFFNEKWFLNG